MEHYTYRPKRFYIIVFALTWGFWALALALKNNNASGAAITGFSAADLNVDGLKFTGTITCTFTIASATWSWAIDGDCTSNGVEVAMASDGTVTPA